MCYTLGESKLKVIFNNMLYVLEGYWILVNLDAFYFF